MDKMNKLIKKLNKLAENGWTKEEYPEILKLSQEIDKYITEDLRKQKKKK